MTTAKQPALLYTWYGDDFTGSTDVLESLATAGVSAVLFLAEPAPEDLAAFPGVQAIGIAGDARSQTPAWMSEHLPGIFTTLKQRNAPVTHYKTCSTFDSAPHIGNIGRAMEIGRETFNTSLLPIVVAAPHLGRFVSFGHLFAAADGIVYRIDRHPTMSCHPVTPMREADLRRHLAAQTKMKIGSVDLRDITAEAIAREQSGGAEAILFDGVNTSDNATVGRLLWSVAQRTPLFATGSSGLTRALTSAWQEDGLITGQPLPEQARPANQVLILSGSCSPITEAQIAWAQQHGFPAIALDPAELLGGNHDACAEQAIDLLYQGASPILYTALGPLSRQEQTHGAALGKALGQLLHHVIKATSIQRIMLCGGDTSSHAIQQLPLRALTWAAPLVPGAPVCRAASPNPRFDGLELILKGGQVGPPDLFAETLFAGNI